MKENHNTTFCLFFFASVQKYSSVGLLNSVVFAPVSQLLALKSCQHASAPMPTRQTLPCLSHLTIKAIPMHSKGGGLQKKIPRQQAQTFVTQQSFPLHLSSPSINTIGSLVIFVYSLPGSAAPRGKKNKKITNKTLRSFQRTSQIASAAPTPCRPAWVYSVSRYLTCQINMSCDSCLTERRPERMKKREDGG